MHHIPILGTSGNAGAYILRISLAAPVAVVLGRLHGGRPFALEAGHYLYVGSARGRRGPASLPGRLLRHASRTRAQPPHRILPDLATALTAAGFAGVQSPQSDKTARWHIDYLLDLPQAELNTLYVLRHPTVRESALVQWLSSLPQVSAPIPGFGASDDPGASHLLWVRVEDRWWAWFWSQLQAWFNNEVAVTARTT